MTYVPKSKRVLTAEYFTSEEELNALTAFPPIRARRTIRVLKIIGFFTLEDLRWMIRVQNDCEKLQFEPSDYFKVLERSMVDALEGNPISLEEELKTFIKGDRHWTKLFREKVMPNFPVIRVANRVISGMLTGGEMYYQWDPNQFFKDLYHHTREKPLFEVWPHETIPFIWAPNRESFTESELETLLFYSEADLDYVFRIPPLTGLTTLFPLSKNEIMQEVNTKPNNLSYNSACLLTAMLKNDVVIWRITELRLGKLIPASNIVWPWGRQIYESKELKTITEKLMWQMQS